MYHYYIFGMEQKGKKNERDEEREREKALYNCKMRKTTNKKMRIVYTSLYSTCKRVANILLAMIFFIFISAGVSSAFARYFSSLVEPNHNPRLWWIERRCSDQEWRSRRDQERKGKKVWILCQFLYLSHSLFAANHHRILRKKSAQLCFVFDANE